MKMKINSIERHTNCQQNNDFGNRNQNQYYELIIMPCKNKYGA